MSDADECRRYVDECMRLADQANNIEVKAKLLKIAYAWFELEIQHLRAQEMRLLAGEVQDPEAQAATLKIADEYDRFALRAAERLGMDKSK